MKRSLVAVLMLLVLIGCQRRPEGPFAEHSHIEERVLGFDDPDDLSLLIWAYVTQLKYERHLHLENAYVCVEPDRSKLHLDFISQDILEMCSARQLLVDVVEGLLDRINLSDVAYQLRPYPFIAENIEIRIDFESFYGIYCDPYYIGWIVLEDGMAYYYAFNVKDKDKDFWSTRYESYAKSKTFAYAQRAAEELYKKEYPINKASVIADEKYSGQNPRADHEDL